MIGSGAIFCAMTLGLTLVIATGAAAQSVPLRQVNRALGSAIAAQFKPSSVETTQNLSRYHYGAAECNSVGKHPETILPNSLVPVVTKARRHAAREVEPFYKDGRPFKE